MSAASRSSSSSVKSKTSFLDYLVVPVKQEKEKALRARMEQDSAPSASEDGAAFGHFDHFGESTDFEQDFSDFTVFSHREGNTTSHPFSSVTPASDLFDDQAIMSRVCELFPDWHESNIEFAKSTTAGSSEADHDNIQHDHGVTYELGSSALGCEDDSISGDGSAAVWFAPTKQSVAVASSSDDNTSQQLRVTGNEDRISQLSGNAYDSMSVSSMHKAAKFRATGNAEAYFEDFLSFASENENSEVPSSPAASSIRSHTRAPATGPPPPPPPPPRVAVPAVATAATAFNLPLDADEPREVNHLFHRTAILHRRRTQSSRQSHFCPFCMEAISNDEYFQMPTCQCIMCKSCAKRAFSVKIREGSVHLMLCPGCSHPCPRSDIAAAVEDSELLDRLDALYFAAEVDNDPSRAWCPKADCNTAVQLSQKADGLYDKFAQCLTCDTQFCADCQCTAWHHGIPCHIFTRTDKDNRKFLNWASRKTKTCPKCNVKIEKLLDGSCNHMSCSRCSCEFCWLCGRVIPPIGHFDKNNLLGCPGLQYGGDSFAPLRRLGARSLVVGRFAGKGILVAAVAPVVVVLAIPMLAYWGTRAVTNRRRRRM